MTHQTPRSGPLIVDSRRVVWFVVVKGLKIDSEGVVLIVKLRWRTLFENSATDSGEGKQRTSAFSKDFISLSKTENGSSLTLSEQSQGLQRLKRILTWGNRLRISLGKPIHSTPPEIIIDEGISSIFSAACLQNPNIASISKDPNSSVVPGMHVRARFRLLTTLWIPESERPSI